MQIKLFLNDKSTKHQVVAHPRPNECLKQNKKEAEIAR